MSGSDNDELFVNHVTAFQRALFAYILILLPDVADASDVLQETNLVLWRKRAEFDIHQNFAPWARAIARYQVLAHFKKQKRERLRFSETLLSQLAEVTVARQAKDSESEQLALENCVDELTPTNRELLRLRYSSGLSLTEIAQRMSRSADAIRGALYRIRGDLAGCIRRKLSAMERNR
jgi:RNA polymerase sigma-70 factor, ECF subfamily